MIVLPKGNNNNYDKLNTHREMVKTNGIIENNDNMKQIATTKTTSTITQNTLSEKSHTIVLMTSI